MFLIHEFFRLRSRPQDRETEEQVFQICARAGVCCIGIPCGYGHALITFSFNRSYNLSGSTRRICKLGRSHSRG